MRSGLVIGGAIVAVVAGGCLLDKHAAKRPARFRVGPSMRTLAVPAGPDGTAATGATARTAGETSGAPDQQLSAVAADMQFAMATAHHTYLGGEVETGKLEAQGSNFAGAYGVAGIELVDGFGSVGAELAVGWRGLRYSIDGQHGDDRLVIEPRIRSQLWIAEQWTVGGMLGTTVGERGEWMGGLYLGLHSARF